MVDYCSRAHLSLSLCIHVCVVYAQTLIHRCDSCTWCTVQDCIFIRISYLWNTYRPKWNKVLQARIHCTTSIIHLNWSICFKIELYVGVVFFLLSNAASTFCVFAMIPVSINSPFDESIKVNSDQITFYSK